MALIGSYTPANIGVALAGAYAQIGAFRGNSSVLFGDVVVYKQKPQPISADNPTPNVQPVETVQVSASYVPGEDAFTTLYNAALALPAFSAMARDDQHLLQRLAMKRRFTSTERIAIRAAAAAGDGVCEDFLDLCDSSVTIDLNDPDTQNGVKYCEAKGYIAAGRAAVILTP